MDATATPAALIASAATEGIRYWEPRRLIYNAVLAAVVILYFVVGLPESGHALSVNTGLMLFNLAVLANALYCFAYIPDIFVQLSSLRAAWLRSRWVLFLIGTTFAANIARSISIDLFK
jgi:hypothetical protein